MDRLAIIDAESHRFAEVLSAADPALRCPTCPDWSASDLLWHLANVHYFWAGVLSRHILDEAEACWSWWPPDGATRRWATLRCGRGPAAVRSRFQVNPQRAVLWMR
jgi:hypothetical protein